MDQRRDKRPPRVVPGSDDDILAWLAKYGTSDKDRAAASSRVRPSTPVRRGKGGTLRMTVDLHGLTCEEASRRLRAAVESCRERGVRELLIIHGQGHHSPRSEGPVLKSMVRDMLECELKLRVRDFHTALPKDGGDGATIAVVR